MRKILKIAFPVLIITLMTKGILTNYFNVVEIEGSSMEPTLVEGEYYNLSKRSKPTTNGVIAIQLLSPPDDLKTSSKKAPSNSILVKRAIAVSGDYIRLTVEGLTVNGHVIIRPEYLKDMNKAVQEKLTTGLTLNGGQVFLIGDNLNHSNDSLDFGLVSDYKYLGTVGDKANPLWVSLTTD